MMMMMIKIKKLGAPFHAITLDEGERKPNFVLGERNQAITLKTGGY